MKGGPKTGWRQGYFPDNSIVCLKYEPVLGRYQTGTLVYRLVLVLVSKNQRHWYDPMQYQPRTNSCLVVINPNTSAISISILGVQMPHTSQKSALNPNTRTSLVWFSFPKVPYHHNQLVCPKVDTHPILIWTNYSSKTKRFWTSRMFWGSLACPSFNCRFGRVVGYDPTTKALKNEIVISDTPIWEILSFSNWS